MFYSGMNDEKYIYFTERIQNTLLKPEILKLMKDVNETGEDVVVGKGAHQAEDAKVEIGGRRTKKGDNRPRLSASSKVPLEDQLKRKQARAE